MSHTTYLNASVSLTLALLAACGQAPSQYVDRTIPAPQATLLGVTETTCRGTVETPMSDPNTLDPADPNHTLEWHYAVDFAYSVLVDKSLDLRQVKLTYGGRDSAIAYRASDPNAFAIYGAIRKLGVLQPTDTMLFLISPDDANQLVVQSDAQGSPNNPNVTMWAFPCSEAQR